jgi:peptidoglycan-associated lipoprotein
MHCGMRMTFTGLVLALAGVGMVGCGSSAKQVKADTTTAAGDQPKKNDPLNATITPAGGGDAAPPTSPIYFDFDSYQVAEPSKAELQQVAEYLGKHPGSSVTISGHTDERGTTEYNLMLGDQRAKAAHDYLVRLGIDPLRIKTISFGEERPAVPGNNDDAYQKNRRDEFNTSGGKAATPTPK